MVKPSINDILEKINNRYYLVGTVAKRAREIVDGSEIYVENKQGENKPVCLASEEVAEGKITYRLLTPEEIEQKERPKIVERIIQEETAIMADKITKEIKTESYNNGWENGYAEAIKKVKNDIPSQINDLVANVFGLVS